jgi:8-oxoguanine deaminase
VKSLLAKNAEVRVTMDDKRRELKNAGLCAVDGAIKQVGPTEDLPKTADVVNLLDRSNSTRSQGSMLSLER